jgi:hypothetical protein
MQLGRIDGFHHHIVVAWGCTASRKEHRGESGET